MSHFEHFEGLSPDIAKMDLRMLILSTGVQTSKTGVQTLKTRVREFSSFDWKFTQMEDPMEDGYLGCLGWRVRRACGRTGYIPPQRGIEVRSIPNYFT